MNYMKLACRHYKLKQQLMHVNSIKTSRKEIDYWYSENLLLTQKLQAEAFSKFTLSKAQKVQLSAGERAHRMLMPCRRY